MSWLAGITQSMMVLGYYIYFLIIFVVTYKIFSSCPSIGILVRPGRSMMVRLGQFAEYTSRIMGLSMIFFLFPHTLSVNN